jgi:hypothetical protein
MLSDLPEARSQRVALLCAAAMAGTIIALFIIIAASPARAVYDEGWYLDTIQLLHRYGLSIAFLRELPGPAGPTFTLVYAGVQSIFAVALPWLRLTNFALLLASTGLLVAVFAASKVRLPGTSLRTSSLLLAGIFVTLPTVAVAAGMTLTEMPALFFVSIFLLTITLDQHGDRIDLAAPAGLALGVAILGRQNYLVVLPCLLALLDKPRYGRSFRFVAIVYLIVVLVSGSVFLVWGALVPPAAASIEASFHPWFVILSFGYLGVLALLIEPRIYAPLVQNKYAFIAVILGALILTAAFGTPLVPARSTLSIVSPELFGWIFPYLSSAIGMAFVIAMAYRLRETWKAPFARFTTAVVFTGALSNAGIHQFSSRYVFMFLPFLLVALGPGIRLSWDLPIRLFGGAALGLTSLAAYFWFSPE